MHPAMPAQAGNPNPFMPNPIKALTLAVVAVIAAAAGVVVASYVLKPDPTESVELVSGGGLLPQPRAIPEFTLTAANGQPLTRAAFQGKWSVIFVGFTHCPDICPNTLGLLKSVRRTLAAQNKSLQVVFLSVDPERDTPELLARYVSYFDPAFLGATGDKTQLDQLGAATGFVYMKSPGATAETYNIDHSSALILVNPQAEVAGYFTAPLKIEALNADLARLIPDES